MALTAEVARALLTYDPETGHIYRKSKLNAPAGNRMRRGYIAIYVSGNGKHLAHRLAWLIVYGCWPNGVIDHINGDPSDNRLCNLREATQLENTFNAKRSKANKSGAKGVHWSALHGRWRARATLNYQSVCLGLHDTVEAAAAAYAEFCAKHRGEFARVA